MTAPDACPSPRCDHLRGCWEGDRRRMEGGHARIVVPNPKMDARDLVAVVCGCGEYRTGPTTEHHGLIAWRMHADAKMRVKGGPPSPERPPAEVVARQDGGRLSPLFGVFSPLEG